MNHRTTEPPNQSPPGWAFYALLGVMMATYLHAQTEVEGEVSGVWNTDGSPYILVGDATVPEDESLTIEPGVEVEFGEGLVLTVNGGLSATGTEDDTIRFHGPEGEVSGRIHLTSTEDPYSFNYCRFDSMEYSLLSFQETSIEIRNCFFYDNEHPLFTPSGFYLQCHDNLFLRSDDGHGAITFGQNWNFAGSYFITGNRIPSYSVGGSIADTMYIAGNEIYSSGIHDCSYLIYRDNIVENQIRVESIRRGLRYGLVEDNTVNDRIRWDNPGQATPVIRNNQVRISITLDHGNYYAEGNRIRGGFLMHSGTGQLVRNQTHHGGLILYGESDVELINNTFIAVDEDPLIYETEEGDSRVTLTNNLFMSIYGTEYAVGERIGINDGGYNCIYGVETPYAERDGLLDNDLFENPLLRGGFPYDYRLRADSPCIDAGDPDSEDDPDGTRADIGAYFFDQENGEPPALVGRWDHYTYWGDNFRYTARAIDEGDELAFSFERLPDWMEIEEEENQRRDFVRDSVVVSGEVPEDQEDFVFLVTATDAEERTDTLSVRVTVYPYHVLTGIVSGTLDIDQSPFIVVDTAWVPEGDSLVLPPGTELYFDNREDTLRNRPQSILMVLGRLRAIGSEEDSSYFHRFDRTRFPRIIYFKENQDEISEFRYCNFDAIKFYSVHECNIWMRNCLASGENPTHAFISGYIQPYLFTENKGQFNNRYFGSGKILNNEINGLAVITSGDSVFVQNNNNIQITASDLRYLEVKDNVFRSGFGSLNGGIQDSKICNNIIYGQGNFSYENASVGMINDNHGTFSNNIIAECDGSVFSIFSGGYVRIFNNAIYSSSVGVSYRNFSANLEFTNNIFWNIDTLITAYRGDVYPMRYNSIGAFNVLSSNENLVWGIDRVNTNGDSTDQFFNIYLDPRLANPDSLDFRLYADSPLINAGNPDEVFNDVDSTVNDIGLYGGPFGESYEYPNGVGESDIPPPEGFTLSSPYPNPFNSQVQFGFTLPVHGDISIMVYDVTGRLVFEDRLTGVSVGSHRYIWRGEDSATGIYYFELTFQGAKLVRQMVMIK